MVRLLIILASSMLTSCAVGHGLTGTPVNIAAEIPAAPLEFQAKTAAEAPLLANWLEQFNDPQMIEVVDEALNANPNLLSSEARVRAAKQNARAVLGRSLPSINYSNSDSFETNFFATTQVNQITGENVVITGRVTQPQFDQRFNFNWELDLWGRVRANNQAAKAAYIATQADLDAAQLSIGGQAAIGWINLKTALAQENISRATVEARQRVLDLTERRLGRGLSTALEVRTARSQLATSEAQVAAQTRTRQEAARGLEVLLGRYPAAAIETDSGLPPLGELQTPGTPANLLVRRPDVAAAEARLEEAGLRAEVARLAIFPTISPTASVSNTTSIRFADIFDPQRISASIAASITQSVWAGGAIKAEKRAALANAEALASDYVGTVLTAWQEVENALDADRLLAEQERAQKIALEEAILAEELATRQYQNGLVNIFNLLNAQTTRLTSEASLVQAQSARIINRVNYHIALGGGLPFEDELLANPPSQSQSTSTSEGSAP